MTRRAATSLALAIAVVAAWQSPAGAHGQGHGELPLARWQVLYAAAAIVVVAWLAGRGRAPGRGSDAAAAGRLLPMWLDRGTSVVGLVLRVVGLVVWGVAITAAWFGTDNARDNLTPALVYVVLWAGMPVLSAVVGDVWRVVSPFDALAAIAPWVRRSTSRDDRPRPADPTRRAALLWSHWPAAVGALGFTWLELGYHSPDEPRVLAVAMTAYTVVVLAVAAPQGREWLRAGEPFAVLFGLFAALAPFFRDDAGRLRARMPLSGLASLRLERGTAAVMCVLLASAGFDGVRSTGWWRDLVEDRAGWGRTAVDTAGLLAVLAIVAAAVLTTGTVTARLTHQSLARVASWQTPALILVAVGFGIGRYFMFFAVEVQSVIANISDPYGEGWDLFGTATNVIRLDVVSASTAAWVLVGAVVLSHAAALWVARRVASAHGAFDGGESIDGQAPLAAALVASAVVGLALLL